MNDQMRDAAFRAGVWQFIEQKAKAQKDAAKAELLALEPGDAVQGKWHGQPVAKATMTAGRTKLVVTDEAALVAWLERTHPTEVVRSPNTAYLKALEKHAVDGAVIDDVGDLVPGVEIRQGDPYVSVRKSDGAEAIIAELFRIGSVGLEGIKAAPLPPIVDPAHLDELPVTRWVEPEPTNRYDQDREAAGL